MAKKDSGKKYKAMATMYSAGWFDSTQFGDKVYPL